MSSDDGDVYVLRDATDADGGAESDWVAPEPVESVVRDQLLAQTDLAADDIGDLEEYVGFDSLKHFFSPAGDEADELDFEIEGYSVRLSKSGDVTVE